MPYPSQVTPAHILTAASEMIAAEGVESLSLGKLAGALGIKAPSLYRYFESKTALLRALNERTLRELINALYPAPEGDAVARVLSMLRAYRTFAHQHAALYGLLFTNTHAGISPEAGLSEALVLPLQAVMAVVSGEAESLAALRGAMALVHGFVMLELAGQFRRGGDLDAAFEAAIGAYVAGWEKHG